jgi:50S ribosomal subunit-associated GTPase HflX
MSENLPALRRANNPYAPAAERNAAVFDDGGSGSGLHGLGETPNRLTSRQLEQLVDQVVERIEARVIDELERRGRRTGGF